MFWLEIGECGDCFVEVFVIWVGVVVVFVL